MKNCRNITVLLLCLILIGSIFCNPFCGSEAESNQQLVEVIRGDLMVTINGIGNIAISEDIEDLNLDTIRFAENEIYSPFQYLEAEEMYLSMAFSFSHPPLKFYWTALAQNG